MLLDSLEVKMEKDAFDAETDDEKTAVKNFEWDVIDFDRDFILLQIRF